jgi:hypothetical protein
MGEKVPVLFKTGRLEPYILFDDKKVYTVEAEDLVFKMQLSRHQHMWVLIDALAFPDGIPAEFLPMRGGPAPMLVYASSPRRSRWKRVRQCGFDVADIVMNPWSKWEAELL